MQQKLFAEAVLKGLNGFVNVREITDSEAENKFFSYDEFQRYKPPQDKNIYIGLFTREGRNGRKEACKETQVLWADFDEGATRETADQRIRESMLPKPSIYINSGHGVHVYWLLDKKAGREVEPVLKAITRATGADTRAAEISRVMRLPGSINVKGEPVPCEIIETDFSNRYKLETFAELLNVAIDDDSVNVKNSTTEAPQELLNADRPCIKSMAAGVKEGHRNFALGRITKYLQVKGYTKEQTRSIILKWNRNNKPQENQEKLTRDFEAYWHVDYKQLGCTIGNADLQSILFDYCDMAECRLSINIGSLKLDNTVKYNNRIFNKIDKLTGNSLIVTGLLTRHKEGLTISLLQQKLTSRAIGKPCMNEKTLRSVLKYLKSNGIIEKIDGNKRAGRENLYKIIPQGTYGMGYTICSNGAINGAIDRRVTSTEFKLYILLLRYAFTKGNCYPAQQTLAKELGVTQQEVSLLLINLEEVDYIKKNIRYSKGVENLVYSLLV